MSDKYYRRGNAEHIVHTTFQDPETGLYEIDGKHLTKDQLDKLIAITPGHRWVIINWHPPILKQQNYNYNHEH